MAFFCASLSLASAQTEDITQPTLTALSFTPTTIDTSAGPASVAVSVSATDDLSGVLEVFTQFDSPTGAQFLGAQVRFPPGALSVQGTSNVTFPQFGETGTWTVTTVRVLDQLGNVRFYTTSALAQLGFPTELVVMGQTEDVTPPMINVSATPKTLWPPNGKMVTVTISGMITDTESGVNASTTAYAVTDEYGLIQPSGGPITLGENGSYSFTISLQAARRENDRDGRQYTIIVSAQDEEGNMGSGFTHVIVPHDQGG
jgi:hypothetical protein